MFLISFFCYFVMFVNSWPKIDRLGLNFTGYVQFRNDSGFNITDASSVPLEQWGLRVTFCVFMALLAVSGTTGNLFVVVSILMVKKLRKLKNVFIFNLGISDLLINSISMPSNILGAMHTASFWDDKATLCDFIASICIPGCSSSVYSIAAIAFERYLCICHLAIHQKLFTMRNTVLMVMVMWINAHLIHLPNHLGWGAIYYDQNFFLCWLDLRLWSFSFFYATYSVLLPIVFCFFAYFKIYMTIRSSKLSRNLIVGKYETEADQVARSAWKEEIVLVKTLFKLFVIFLISWGPVAFLFCFNKAIDPPRWVNLLAIMMAHGNSSTNSLLYYWLNGHFMATVNSAKSYVKQKRSNVIPLGEMSGMRSGVFTHERPCSFTGMGD